ncbi:MAG: transcription-repair coupling factor [Phycisphaera sp.]|nr:transcription-repair coupling factor [Phycisphaera sp.]
MPPNPLEFLRLFVASPFVKTVCGQLTHKRRVVIDGSFGSSTHLLAGSTAVTLYQRIVLVVAHLDEADDALDDLEMFPSAGCGLELLRFGALEVLPGESSVSLDLLAQRLAIVKQLTNGKSTQNAAPGILVAPIQALMQSVPLPGALEDFTLCVERGKTLPPGQLLDWLDRAGYKRTDAVEQPGDFSMRGGIIDIYLPTPLDEPRGEQSASRDASVEPAVIRLDYFGDEIDALHRVNPETMGSAGKIERADLLGASAQKLLTDDRTTSLLSLLPDTTPVVLHEVMEIAEQARGYYERLTNPRGIYSPQAVLKALTQRPHIECNHYSTTSDKTQAIPFPGAALPAFDQDAGKAVKELGELARNSQVVVMCQKEAERERLKELLHQHAPDTASAITLENAYLHRGFVWNGDAARHPLNDDSSSSSDHQSSIINHQSLLLVPHHELFHRYMTRRRIRRIITPGSSTIDAPGKRVSDVFLEIVPEDYVVHVDHGIAKFVGLRTMHRNGQTQEYLTLSFADNATLHVPASQIDLVQKYVGGFHGHPPLSTLGGKRWKKQKEQVEEAVKDMAAEMLRIQAARASLPGVRYPEDTAWQKEFEAEFPYDETDDQLSAISAVKKDMADEQPMDRLICGDVGFGKTEVAIRAAFKAAEYGKQVAVLVPTTVLAEQHERTFRGRMADYPFRIESLSRFKSDADQRKTLEAVALGRVDIVIGTHRLLSQDVKFADLGLVIIDEEQRFGVEHKQRLLQFRLTADVLTLSATPIPRTLHMSMLGLRDISSLSTAPLDRRAIVTEVIPYDKGRIKQAIDRELSREGQVFFVHNRVHDIHSVADDVQRLAPDAKIVVGHGQMAGHELEEVMLAFIRRKADILVSTTIIESGIDIPTANTMIIDGADHFGLADLHQLRGRVGRYKHRAYCYLLLPEDRPVTDMAARRLKAIEQYSMLGAGFKIAMRDLEIRGAGNLLGAEQSGHIAAVGYEMYCQLLEQAARRLKDERVIEPSKTHIELPLSGRLPKQYIASDKHRMEAYRRISRSSSLEELDAVERDLTDAFGKPPEAARVLLDLAALRIAASLVMVDSIKLEGPDVILKCQSPARLDPLLKNARGRVSVIDVKTVYYRPPANYVHDPMSLLTVLRHLFTLPTGRTTPTPPVRYYSER